MGASAIKIIFLALLADISTPDLKSVFLLFRCRLTSASKANGKIMPNGIQTNNNKKHQPYPPSLPIFPPYKIPLNLHFIVAKLDRFLMINWMLR